MAKNFPSVVSSYLTELQAEYDRAQKSGQATSELSYRAVLDRFFMELTESLGARGVEKIFEPKNQGKAGRPDWRFHDGKSMALFGYVEAKALDPVESINPADHTEQVQRYRTLGHPLILTDGLDFVFYWPKSDSPEFYSLLPGANSKKWSAEQPSPLLETAFRKFFSSPGQHPVSTAELIRKMAVYAKQLSASIGELVGEDPGSGMDKQEREIIAELQKMKETLAAAHDPELSQDDRFRDMVAQTLVFGLLYAHSNLAHLELSPAERAAALSKFWLEKIHKDGANRLRPFRALAHIMGGQSTLGPISTWYGDCVLYLSNVAEKSKEPATGYHTLYEQFLRAYAPDVKEEFGAYATPPEIAAYCVAFCDLIAKSMFRHKTIFAGKNKIIDPACGTGQFLEECVKYAQERGIGAKDCATIAGFEILPTPYALAQHRLAELSRDGFDVANRVRVMLCNTLSNEIVDAELDDEAYSDDEGSMLLREEGVEAVSFSKPPITLVLGNPPSSDKKIKTDSGTYDRILELVNDFRPPKSGRHARQNTQKQMQNDFIKFLRWACLKIPRNRPGIVSYVIPASFLKADGYKHARQWLLKNFSDIWVLEFDSDLRTRVVTENIFQTLQGRAMIICAHDPEASGKCAVNYQSILDLSRSGKQEFFRKQYEKIMAAAGVDAVSGFEVVVPGEPDFYLKPAKKYDQDAYKKFWSLSADGVGIFLRHTSGVKMGATAALVHADRSVLLRRSKEIGNDEKTFSDLMDKWFKGQRKPPRKETLRPATREAFSDFAKAENVKAYSFRPFVNLFAVLSEELFKQLGRSGGGGARSRPEVAAAYETDNMGLAVAPGPEDLGEEIQRFATLAWNTPDNDLCRRGNAHVFAVRFPEYKKTGSAKWVNTPRLNISPAILKALGDSTGKSEALAREIFYFTYAVLCAPRYLKEFMGALLHTAGAWPRIPIPKSEKMFKEISALGRHIAELEKEPEAHAISKNLASNLKSLPKNEIRVKNVNIEPENGRIILISESGQSYTLDGIDPRVLAYKVSGYDVVREWLKWHTDPYLNRSFNTNDGAALLGVISAITDQIEAIASVDALLATYMTQEDALLPSLKDS